MLQNNTDEIKISFIEEVETVLLDTVEIKPGITIDSLSKLPDEFILAMILFSECRGCIPIEKEIVAHSIYMRAKNNFDGNGEGLIEQVTAKYQFSNAFKKGRTIKNVTYNPKKKTSIECLEIARKTISGGTDFQKTLPCNLHYFCNSKIATNEKEVRRQKRDRHVLNLPKETIENFGHDIFAIDKKCDCNDKKINS
jgi:hypothetical protein